MICKPPKNKYEQYIYDILTTSEYFTSQHKTKDGMVDDWAPGERSIIYDFAIEYIPKYIPINWEELDLEQYVLDISLIYDKHKSTPGINLVSACINKIFKNQYKSEVIGTQDRKELLVEKL